MVITNMKRTIILEVILTIAVIILFILHFSTKEKKTAINLSNNGSCTMAFVNVDSILMNYVFSQKLHEEFTRSQETFINEYTVMRAALEEKVSRFQEKVKRGEFSTKEQVIIEQDRIASDQEALAKLDQELSNKLTEIQSKNSKTVIDSLLSAIKRYNSVNKYKYIVNSINILEAEQTTNISKDILEMLNSEYSNSTK